MAKKYKILLLSLAIMLCLSIVAGTSYSLWSSTYTQSTSNKIAIGCFTIDFSEAGTNINLANTYPISDAKGLAKTPYTFTVSNTCTITSQTNIAVDVLNTSTMSSGYIKAAIKEGSGNAVVKGLLNTLSAGTIASGDTETKESWILDTITLKPNETKTYSIYMWVGETINNDAQGKTLNAKINVSDYAAKTLTYTDGTGANQPELYQVLIPVKYDASGNTVVADTYQEWYNYASHNWANAVLVNCADATIKAKYFNDDMSLKTSAIGTTMTDTDILQYYVWIPRYKYLLWNTANGTSNPQAISITFEKAPAAKSTGSTNGTWLTHPAFTFGTTELPGIWVGKFETSGTETALTIKPNITSLRSITLGAMFNAARNIELTYASNFGISSSQIDTHMMKNMEWGATAYLSSSIYGRYTDTSTCVASGCKVWINNNSSRITGCSGSSVSAATDIVNTTSCASGYSWSESGVNASTTGNQYGIYDMSGGACDYVMGNSLTTSGTFNTGSSTLSQPDSKYYDSYNAGDIFEFSRGKLGDSVRETIQSFNSDISAWNNEKSGLPDKDYPWFERGSGLTQSTAGIFAFVRNNGGADASHTFRSVITAE